MTERTIDLRKSKMEPRATSIPMLVNPALDRGALKSGVKHETVEWSALEFEKRERGPYWFLLMGALAAGLIIFGVLTRSYFFVAFVALASVILAVYARREPREITFTITAEGVGTGGTFFPFSELKTFWIFDEEGRKELSLETKRVLTPFVRIPLEEKNPEDIRNFVSDFLPEEEHKELATDQIARSLGL